MAPSLLLSFILLLSVSLTHSSLLGNVTVVGTVFCDACSESTFSKHSYFLEGAKVQVVCKFSSNTVATEEISISIERTTDKFGGYKLDVPSVDDFECREGRELKPLCKASLVQSPLSRCNIPSLSTSTELVAVKAGESKSCVYDLNALTYRPAQRDASLCGKREEVASLITAEPDNSVSALFFWPPFLPWPYGPPFHFPSPPYLYFPFPLPFPFPNQQPSLPFPFPPIPFFAPPPPAFSPPFFPIPFLAPPPSSRFPFPFPFPFPPSPSLNPTPSVYPLPLPPPLTNSPPAPAFPFPFIPLPPLFPFPRSPSPPPAFTMNVPQKQNKP